MKIAIAGFGVEGRSSYDYFSKLYPAATMIIADENPPTDPPAGAEVRTGSQVFENQLLGVDLVIRTPSLAPSRIITDGKIWSASNEFFAKCPSQIIGVTGTKGKGTVSSLITAILEASGKTVHLVGNIGRPALDILDAIQPDDIVVYELSSFQLWDLETSPHIAVVLMIEPDHLDIHRDFDEYCQAKSHIAAFQTEDDWLVYSSQSAVSRAVADNSIAQRLAYPTELSEQVVKSLKLPGKHNIDNLSAAVLAAKCIQPDLTDEVIAQGVAGFAGLPHRLQFVAKKRGVSYYDDSIATTPGSAIAAIKSFVEPKIIILGGSDKGADYQELIDLCRATSTKIVCIGQVGKAIYQLARASGVQAELTGGDMADIVTRAAALASPGSVVILSPAAASFDSFTSYQDRGDQFTKQVGGIE